MTDKRTIYCDERYIYFVATTVSTKAIDYWFPAAAPINHMLTHAVMPTIESRYRRSFKEAQTDLNDWAEKQNLQRFEAVNE